MVNACVWISAFSTLPSGLHGRSSVFNPQWILGLCTIHCRAWLSRSLPACSGSYIDIIFLQGVCTNGTKSHKSFLHLLANCLALEGFGAAAYLYLAKEQDKAAPAQLEVSPSWHFLAFFVSGNLQASHLLPRLTFLAAGLFSGLVSHVVATKFMYPRMVAKLSALSGPTKVDTWASAVASSSASAAKTAVSRPILPSLGASGAIYASVTLTALAFPGSQVSLMIPPSYPIDIQTGVGALVLLDIIGAARGWRSVSPYL